MKNRYILYAVVSLLIISSTLSMATFQDSIGIIQKNNQNIMNIPSTS